MKEIPQFTHIPPEGMYYEVESFKRNVLSIWVCYRRKFDYNLGESTKCIWGFYDTKKSKFYSPVNSKTVGKEVEFSHTTPYSAMIPKQTPLQAAFV
jgi:hypothetical protein